MPFYKVYIHVKKDVFRWKKPCMLKLDDVYRHLEIKENVKGFNVAFDDTIDVNDFGELGTSFNFHRDYSNFSNTLTDYFDTTQYTMKEDLSCFSAEVSITLVDREKVPFTNHSKDLIGTCFVIDDYAKKCMKSDHGLIFKRTSKNEFFEIETRIILNKKDFV
jgi:hypothetical protein